MSGAVVWWQLVQRQQGSAWDTGHGNNGMHDAARYDALTRKSPSNSLSCVEQTAAATPPAAAAAGSAASSTHSLEGRPPGRSQVVSDPHRIGLVALDRYSLYLAVQRPRASVIDRLVCTEVVPAAARACSGTNTPGPGRRCCMSSDRYLSFRLFQGAEAAAAAAAAAEPGGGDVAPSRHTE